MADQSAITEYFSKFGEIKDVFVPRKEESSFRLARHRGIAYIQFRDWRDTLKVLSKVHYMKGKWVS